MANDAHEDLIRMPSGTRVDQPLGFPAFGVSVDNNTDQWVELPDVGRFVAPNTSRQLSLNGKQGAKALFNAPPGKTQPAATANQEAVLVFTSERLQTTGAQIPNVLSSTVTLDNCRAFSSVNVPVNTAVFTAIPLDSDEIDTGNLHDTAVNNTRITFQRAGFYNCAGCIQWTAAGGVVRAVGIRLNGGTFLVLQSMNPTGMAGLVFVSVAVGDTFGVGDFIELVGYQDSGAPLNATPATRYSLYLSALQSS